MNVVAVWWESPAYPRAYVDALQSQIPGLIVLSTHPDYRTLIEPQRYQGWWSKLEVFRPENRDLRPCLCIDLDTLVFDLRAITALEPSGLWLIREFLARQRDGQSGLFIAPKHGISDEIWAAAERLTHEDFADPYGDGGFLRRFPFRFIPDEVDGILSYKAHSPSGPDGKVICFHGNPKPHNAGGWAQEYWERHADTGSRIRRPASRHAG